MYTNYISEITGLLHRLKEEYLPSILKSIYNTLKLSYLKSCILWWGSQCYEICLLQKCAIRNIEKAAHRALTEPIFTINRINVKDTNYLAT